MKIHICEQGSKKFLCGRSLHDFVFITTAIKSKDRNDKPEIWCKICKMLFNANVAKPNEKLK